ncbi:MAG: MarR family transcriptional regulator [Chloroflexi bacterium]|nr:MarR family transcriptional regulator [Chloroflexota bacterium]
MQDSGLPPEVEQNLEQLILRAAWLERRHFARTLSLYGLTAPQFHTLNVIRAIGGRCAMSELAEYTMQVLPSLTGIVGRLEQAGLVTRERSTADRRVVLVMLTKHGEAVVDEVRQTRRKQLIRTLSRLKPEEEKQFISLMTKYLEALQGELEREEQSEERRKVAGV